MAQRFCKKVNKKEDINEQQRRAEKKPETRNQKVNQRLPYCMAYNIGTCNKVLPGQPCTDQLGEQHIHKCCHKNCKENHQFCEKHMDQEYQGPRKQQKQQKIEKVDKEETSTTHK